MAEHFDFHESFSASVNDFSTVILGKYKPEPGEVVVEAIGEDDEVLRMESLNGVPSAPRSSCYVSENMFADPWDRVNGHPGTVHVDGFGKASLEWECPVDFRLPFDIPDYIRHTPGARCLRVWWGSKAKQEHNE